ncbi:hypothetical protein TCAL_15154 [Tigriopus californicus]|uniref:Uncharacterized protein n=1 Tax=Tigriopus californicus TaxID=6832 RepID=A0A553NVT0_TIGCA|nr:hypothetical protein TCAL_15154 [Tigriopus californicus]
MCHDSYQSRRTRSKKEEANENEGDEDEDEAITPKGPDDSGWVSGQDVTRRRAKRNFIPPIHKPGMEHAEEFRF